MDSSYIIPFIKSVKNVFETMFQMTVQVDKPVIKQPNADARHDISGIIGLSGDVEGAVNVSFPRETAIRIVEKFVGEMLEPEHEDFADAIGELVNMISGGAKAQLEGKEVSISCPSVVIGKGHVVLSPSDVVCIALPCKVAVGDFEVEVAIKKACLAAAAA